MKIVRKFRLLLLPVVLLGTSAAMTTPAAHAQGFLDRIREKADAATDSVREVRDGVEDVTQADERAAAEVAATQRGVQREFETATDIEGQARSAASDTELVRTARQTEREAARIGTADERLEGQIAGQAAREAAAAEREVRNATDVEGRTERAVRNSAPGRAVVQTEREITRIEQTDERIEANTERRVDNALGISETERSVNEVERDVRNTQRSLENLEAELD